jgi:hypothetical protein
MRHLEDATGAASRPFVGVRPLAAARGLFVDGMSKAPGVHCAQMVPKRRGMRWQRTRSEGKRRDTRVRD